VAQALISLTNLDSSGRLFAKVREDGAGSYETKRPNP